MARVSPPLVGDRTARLSLALTRPWMACLRSPPDYPTTAGPLNAVPVGLATPISPVYVDAPPYDPHAQAGFTLAPQAPTPQHYISPGQAFGGYTPVPAPYAPPQQMVTYPQQMMPYQPMPQEPMMPYQAVPQAMPTVPAPIMQPVPQPIVVITTIQPAFIPVSPPTYIGYY